VSEGIRFFALAEDKGEALVDGLRSRPEGLLPVTPEIYGDSAQEVTGDEEHHGYDDEEVVAPAEGAERDCMANHEARWKAHQAGIKRCEDIEGRIEGDREECREETESDGAGVETEMIVEDDKE